MNIFHKIKEEKKRLDNLEEENKQLRIELEQCKERLEKRRIEIKNLILDKTDQELQVDETYYDDIYG